MENKKCEMGMIGLGVMGRNFLLNIADHNHTVGGYDKDLTKVEALRKESNGRVFGAESISDFIDLLALPRVIMLLVPSGAPVDESIKELLPYLQKGDVIIDGGNSYYKDTEVRAKNLAHHGIEFVGVGISGGEKGARNGPSIMYGGPKDVYKHLRNMLESCAAKVKGDPCVAYLGPRGAGHYVKMVHNGIEYGIMQLISETYDLLKRGFDFKDDELQKVFQNWNKGSLNGYLIEITAEIFGKIDEITGKKLINKVLDVAKQLGTGMWTSQSAMEFHEPSPTIDQAVVARNLSMLPEERAQASKILTRPMHFFEGDRKVFLEHLQQALYVSIILSYIQGMALLHVASENLDYQLNLETIARIWRGGCIIRSAFLEDIRKAFKINPNLSNLFFDQEIARIVMTHQESLREVVQIGIKIGIPMPCLMASLSYLDGYRSEWLPANLIQCQRDFFGSHTYERIDEKGTFHTNWENSQIC